MCQQSFAEDAIDPGVVSLCNSRAQIANRIMTARQEGAALSELLEIFNPQNEETETNKRFAETA